MKLLELAPRRVTPDDSIDNPVLAIEDLRVTFGGAGGVQVVRGVSLRIEPGATLVLLGESGSGKSVTPRSVLRLFGPEASVSGRVLLDGVDLLSLPEAQMRQLRGSAIGFVPQDANGSLDPLRRIGPQIAEVMRAHDRATTRSIARTRALESLRLVGIPDPPRVARSYPHELSGGMRQRALIAMAIACEPRLLIADEPTTALDVTIQAQVLDLFDKIQRELGMAILMVTHDVGVARQIADRVAVMYAGRLVEEGSNENVLEQACHPYTLGLLGAVPSHAVPRGELAAIPGAPPAANHLSDVGCAFAPRCDLAEDSCRSDLPPLVSVGPAHDSACPLNRPMEPQAAIGSTHQTELSAQ